MAMVNKTGQTRVNPSSNGGGGYYYVLPVDGEKLLVSIKVLAGMQSMSSIDYVFLMEKDLF